MPPHSEPHITLDLPGGRITLLGTAHVSRTSADTVREFLATGDYDAVAVELCPSRHGAITDPETLARLDLFQVLRSGRAPMVVASLALGAYQQRLADQFGIEPGAEMRAALLCAKTAHLPVLLVDRDVGITLRRTYRNVPWWRRAGLLMGLLASVLSREQVSEAQVERLKEGDMLESTFAQFADQHRDLFTPLIDERDRYMAARLRAELATNHYDHVLAVVGAGHLKGIQRHLREDRSAPATVVDALDRLPPPSPWPRLIPGLIVGLVLVGFAIGFARGPELGWSLVADWVWINGGLAALGALVAAGHPLTVASAFIAAPLTSLNPTVGAGMATAAVELYLRKPTVGDFGQLRHDTSSLGGWWRNRVARTFLVFLFSTLGSAVGTYLAGFRIAGRLIG